VRLADGRAEGPLTFDDVQFLAPLVIERARLAGPVRFARSRFWRGIELMDARFDDDLAIESSYLRGRLGAEHVTIAGDLTLRDVFVADLGGAAPCADPPCYAVDLTGTAIDGNLVISDSLLFSTRRDEPHGSQDEPRSLELGGATVGRMVEIRHNRVDGRVYLSDIRASGLSIERNDVARLVVMEQIGAGTLRSHANLLRSLVVIRDNDIEDQLSLLGDRLGADGQTVVVTRNRVGGTLEVGPESLFSADAVASRLGLVDLTANRVGGQLAVAIPAAEGDAAGVRTGLSQLDLSGTTVDGQLTLLLAREARERFGGLRSSALARWRGDEGPCEGPSPHAGEMLVDLTNVRVATLAWDLPVGDCRFRWRAANLAFDYWGVPLETRAQAVYGAAPGSGEKRCVELRLDPLSPVPSEGEVQSCRITDDDFLDAVQAWRLQQDRATSDFLAALADHLEMRGRLWDSLNVRAEAKALHFSEATRTIDPALADVGLVTTTERVVRWLFGKVMSLTGYGVMPHRVLLWLIMVWLGGVMVYGWVVYHRHQGWRAGPLPPVDGTSPPEIRSRVPGFMQFNDAARPQTFSILGYSLDATLPVVDLHVFNRYYPQDDWVQIVAKAQRCAGWFLLTVLIASAAVL
jgi:hypothetical protein